MRSCTLLLAFLLGPAALAGQRATLAGRVLDAEARTPVEAATVTLLPTGRETVTDADGYFRFARVGAGRVALRVQHLAYGIHRDSLEVAAGTETTIVLLVSRRAIELQPVRVIATSAGGSARRSNVITRDRIEALTPGARHLGDIIVASIPGSRLREYSTGDFCLEFRGGRGARFQAGCNTPLIVVDELPVSHPSDFLRDTPPAEIERIEYIPASEAGARYGVGSQYGVLVIQTRRAPRPASAAPAGATRYPGYAWPTGERAHPWVRAWTAATVGNAAGMAASLAAMGCLSGGIDVACVAAHQGPGAYASLALPALGAAAGARLFGVTRGSAGRPLFAFLATAAPLVLGYAMYADGSRHGFSGSRRAGAILVLIGAPAAATAADALFRRRRP